MVKYDFIERLEVGEKQKFKYIFGFEKCVARKVVSFQTDTIRGYISLLFHIPPLNFISFYILFDHTHKTQYP